MHFKKWLQLQEVGTSTGDVAIFSLPVLPMIRRMWFPPWGDEDQDDFFKKSKKKKKKRED